MDEFFQLVPKKYTTKLQLKKSHTKEIVFRHGHIAITDYKLGDNREFEKSLSTFEELTHKYTLVGGYYVKALHEFRINRAYNPAKIAEYFPDYPARVENDPYPSDKVDIKLMAPPRDDFQRVALTFMCSQGEYHANSRYTQQLIDGDAGDGKTFCGIAVSCFMQARSVIIVPLGRVIEQWFESAQKFTDLKKSEILIVRGTEVCEDIIEGKYKKVKCFIFSSNTISAFHRRYGDLETIELFRATNAYLKIIDEVHLDLELTSMIEALCNFHMNFYMSASPGRSDRKENWIFNTCFRNMPRFGSKFKMEEEQHVNVIVKRYRFVPTPEQQRGMTHPRTKWLNSKKYEKELITTPASEMNTFGEELEKMLNWSKRLLKSGNKVLILCGTIDGTDYIKSIAEKVFPGEAAVYHGSLTKKEKEEALTHTVICATESSMGTGADVPKIQHTYNITTYTTWIGTIQNGGRGRKLKDGTDVFYIELVNMSYIKTLRQYEKRKPSLIKRSKTGKLIVID